MSGQERVVRPTELVGSWEIGQILGATQEQTLRWANDRNDFPAPVVRTGPNKRNRLWVRSDILQWARANGFSVNEVAAAEPDPDELMTATEIAAMFGWSQVGNAWDLAKRGAFPQPVRSHGRTKLWSRREIEEWDRTAPRVSRRTAAAE